MDATALADESATMELRMLQGVTFRVLNTEEAIAFVDTEFSEHRALRLAFANSHTLNLARCSDRYKDTLARFVVFNDGFGVQLASRFSYGTGFPTNLNGTDFVPSYLSGTKNRYRVLMLGAQPDIAERAFSAAQMMFPNHDWIGFKNGYSDISDEAGLLKMIRDEKPDLLLVALGNPLQEYWIDRCSSQLDIPLCFAVGALFDFWSGSVDRAPRWLRSINSEWMYRLFLEPRRLWRRYLIGNPTFLWHAWKDSR
jgi:alpha-1,3-mannosyltransferase